jgi:hypothetical protein
MYWLLFTLIHDSVCITQKPKHSWDDIKMEQRVEKIQLAQYAPVAAIVNTAMNLKFQKKLLTISSMELGLINANISTLVGSNCLALGLYLEEVLWFIPGQGYQRFFVGFLIPFMQSQLVPLIGPRPLLATSFPTHLIVEIFEFVVSDTIT